MFVWFLVDSQSGLFADLRLSAKSNNELSTPVFAQDVWDASLFVPIHFSITKGFEILPLVRIDGLTTEGTRGVFATHVNVDGYPL